MAVIDDDPSDGIDPESLDDLQAAFDSTLRRSQMGYMIELYVGRFDAEEMVKGWVRGVLGDDEELERCMHNYSYIMRQLMAQMKKDDLGDDSEDDD
jgi:hypothetical protein